MLEHGYSSTTNMHILLLVKQTCAFCLKSFLGFLTSQHRIESLLLILKIFLFFFSTCSAKKIYGHILAITWAQYPRTEAIMQQMFVS